MSEDYKKIEFGEVEEGQRVQIALYYATHAASYTGMVIDIDPNWKVISLGDDLDVFRVYLTSQLREPDIFLLEDVPEPKGDRPDTVTFGAEGADGADRLSLTMTVLGSGSARVESDRGESFTFLTDMTHGGATYFEDTGILRFAGVEHWERHEERLRDKWLKDSEGDVWAYIDGRWQYKFDGGRQWSDDAAIEDYAAGGFTIVDSLD